MFKIGCHLSASKGFTAMGKDALKIGANTFQFFTRNPRGGKAKAIDEKDVAAYQTLSKENGFGLIVAHAPYTLNLCSADEGIRQFGKDMLADDLLRMEYVPGNLYNFHPGSHVGQGKEIGIKIIAGVLNDLLTPQQSTVVLLETMAGKGSEIGGCFEDLRDIINLVEQKDKIGVCLDTCHVHDAGYDIIHDLDNVLDEFDSLIGLHRLKAIHLNDTLNPLESRKDRHAKIGEGMIGLEAICRIINHTKLRKLPFLLETPNELEGYAKEINLLKEHYIT